MDSRRIVISGILGIRDDGRGMGWGLDRWAGDPGSPAPTRELLERIGKEEDDRDDQRVDGERLDQGQTDDHRGLDPGGGARLARDSLEGGRDRPPLTQAAEAGREGHPDPGGDHREGPEPGAL